MQTEYVALEHAQALDDFVNNHPNGHFMQTSYWGRVKTDWQWQGLMVRGEAGKIVGTMALLIHPMRFYQTSLVYAPRGPICDDSDTITFRLLLHEAERFAKGIHACVLRLDPMIPETDVKHKNLFKRLGFHILQRDDYSLFQPRLCYVLNLKSLHAENLERSYHRSVRCNLHKAIRNGVAVRRCGLEDLKSFCALMKLTARKNHFIPRTESYFRSFLRGMGQHACLYIAEQGGSALAGAITVTYGRTCWYMYSCSDPNSWKLHPNEILQYRMQLDAIAAGCERFDFRGVEGRPVSDNPHYGLHQFKAGFGAEFHAYLGQLDHVLRPIPALCLRFSELCHRMMDRYGIIT